MTKILLGFLVGVGVGAGIALLSAPATGQDLRAQLRNHADADYKKLRGDWQNGVQEVQSRFDQMQADLSGSVGKLGHEEAEEAA